MMELLGSQTQNFAFTRWINRGGRGWQTGLAIALGADAIGSLNPGFGGVVHVAGAGRGGQVGERSAPHGDLNHPDGARRIAGAAPGEPAGAIGLGRRGQADGRHDRTGVGSRGRDAEQSKLGGRRGIIQDHEVHELADHGIGGWPLRPFHFGRDFAGVLGRIAGGQRGAEGIGGRRHSRDILGRKAEVVAHGDEVRGELLILIVGPGVGGRNFKFPC